MNPKTIKNPEEKFAAPKTEKLPYEAPQAVFVPLKLEERLLACAKHAWEQFPPCNSNYLNS